MLEHQDEIHFGEPVIIYIDPKTIKCVKLEDKHYLDTKFGRFYHDQFVGKKYGTIVETNNKKGFVYCFKLDAEFFTLTLAHQTQILYYPDISLVLHNLGITKGSIVCESGSGSGSMTFSLATAVGNTGKVVTFEYNEQRQKNIEDIFNALNFNQVK